MRMRRPLTTNAPPKPAPDTGHILSPATTSIGVRYETPRLGFAEWLKEIAPCWLVYSNLYDRVAPIAFPTTTPLGEWERLSVLWTPKVCLLPWEGSLACSYLYTG